MSTGFMLMAGYPAWVLFCALQGSCHIVSTIKEKKNLVAFLQVKRGGGGGGGFD